MLRSYDEFVSTGRARLHPDTGSQPVIEGSVVDIVWRGDQMISKRPHSLAEMMSRVAPDNLHAEFGTGRPVGNETW